MIVFFLQFSVLIMNNITYLYKISMSKDRQTGVQKDGNVSVVLFFKLKDRRDIEEMTNICKRSRTQVAYFQKGNKESQM